MKNLATMLEIKEDEESCISLGLTEEEIQGYTEFFIANYFELTDDSKYLKTKGLQS